jgi:hypothetical protein
MGKMKSAFEKAMEKADLVQKASPDQLKKIEHVSSGNTIGARYVRGDVRDIVAELSSYDTETRAHLVIGVKETLARNLSLPLDPPSKNTAEKALKGLLDLFGDKAAIKQVCDQIQHLLTYYEQAAQQEYLRFKQQFAAMLNDPRNPLAMQIGPGFSGDIERLPQFREEWRKVRAQLDSQYEQALYDQKQMLLNER